MPQCGFYLTANQHPSFGTSFHGSYIFIALFTGNGKHWKQHLQGKTTKAEEMHSKNGLPSFLIHINKAQTIHNWIPEHRHTI